MTSFTQNEIRFLKECVYLYKKDGYKLPEGVVRLNREYQDDLLSSSLDKLTNVLRNDPLTKIEATILLCTIRHVSAHYVIDDSSFDMLGLYNRLSALAGMDPLG